MRLTEDMDFKNLKKLKFTHSVDSVEVLDTTEISFRALRNTISLCANVPEQGAKIELRLALFALDNSVVTKKRKRTIVTDEIRL